MSEVKKVCVRSSINVDEFFEVEHIVLSGETIASTSYSRRPGGKGANCATTIAKASGAVDFCGTISKSDGWLRETLTSYGVGASLETLLESEEQPTGRAIIQLSTSTADNSIILLPGSNYSSYPLPSPLSARYSHVLVQNEIPLEQTIEALQNARKEGLTTIFNPSPIPAIQAVRKQVPWDAVDWLVLNYEEAKSLGDCFEGQSSDAEDRLDRLARLLPGTQGLVMTKGADGVEAIIKDDAGQAQTLSCPAGKPVSAIKDTTGAGDTFTGYLASLLMQLAPAKPTKAQLASILEIACEAGTACCEKNGAMEAIPTMIEVQERFKSANRQWPAL